MSQFAKTKAVARKRYAAFVDEGVGKTALWSELKGQVLLGSEQFIKLMAPHLEEQAAVFEVPKNQRMLHRPTLDELFSGTKTKSVRNAVNARCYLEYSYTQAEIASSLGLHDATVSRIIKSEES